MKSPSTNGENGRDSQGRFIAGNSGGPGNPHIKRVAKLRRALLSAVTEDDLIQITAAVCNAAKAGDLAAARFLISYIVGTPADIEKERRTILMEEGMDHMGHLTCLDYPHV